jgi:hypothetical protein
MTDLANVVAEREAALATARASVVACESELMKARARLREHPIDLEPIRVARVALEDAHEVELAQQARVDEARECLREQERAADIARLRALEKKAAAFGAELDPNIARLVELEREVAAVGDAIMAKVREERSIALQAAELAAALGVEHYAQPVAVAHVRGFVAAAITKARAIEGRHLGEKGSVWIAPVTAQEAS